MKDPAEDPVKIRLYQEGRYQCPPPPACTVLWDDKAWIRFIDRDGKWADTTRGREDNR